MISPSLSAGTYSCGLGTFERAADGELPAHRKITRALDINMTTDDRLVVFITGKDMFPLTPSWSFYGTPA